MSRFALAAIAALGTLVVPVAPVAAADHAADEKAILKLENDLTVAIRSRDLAVLEALLTEDWNLNGPFGTQTRAQYVADLKSGAYKIESLSAPHDMKARFFGDVAIVTGASEEKSSWNGKDTSGAWSWMDVWVKRKGEWKQVATQATRLAGK